MGERSRTGFVGRARDLERLAGSAREALQGRGRVVLIAGEAGIGKTALVEEAAKDAAAHGFTVLRGACWEGEGAPAYWPWVQVVRAYARGATADDLLKKMGDGAPLIARLVPEVGRMFLALPEADEETDPKRARFRLFDHLTALLRAITSERPLFIALDDLHWADPSSLLLLRFVARELRDAAILVVGTLRDEEAGDALAEVLAEAGRDRIVLAGLGAGEVAELISSTTGVDAPDELVHAIHHRTTGNPFLVTETARLLEAQGRLNAASVELAIPQGARDVLGRRLARLSQRCVATLSGASVLGASFGLEILTPVLERPAEEVVADLEEAAHARLVGAAGNAGRYEFAHALIREVVYDNLTAPDRGALHQRAGEVIEAHYASNLEPYLAEIANHLMRATPARSLEKAADFSKRAGIRALRLYAYDEAANHLRNAARALELAGESAHVRLGVLLNLADALTRAGDRPHARETYAEVAAAASSAGDAEALAHAALGMGGGVAGFEVSLFDEEQLRLLRDALALQAEQDSSLRAWLLARLSVAQSYVEKPAIRAATAREAVDMARRVGDYSALAYALSSLCDAISDPDHVVDRVEAANEILDAAARISGNSCGVPSCEVCLCDPEMTMLGRRFLVVAELERGNMTAADEHIEMYARLAEHMRQPQYRWYVPLWRAMQALMRGDRETFRRRHAEAAAIGEQARSDNASVLSVSQRIGEARLNRDREQALSAWQEFVAAFSGQITGDQARMMQIWIDALFGDPESGRARLSALVPHLEDLTRDAEWLPGLCALAEAVAELGDGDAARRVYAMLTPYEGLVSVEGIGAVVHGSVSHFLGLLAAKLGRTEDAEGHFRAALAVHEGWHADALVARTKEEYERLLGGGEASGPHAVLRRDGDVWTVGWNESVVHMKIAKGLRDIATLVAQSGSEVHASELIAADATTAARGSVPEGLGGVEAGVGDALDDRARAAYKERLIELQEEHDEAEAANDAERTARAREEMDFIASQLAGAFGLGGRPRPQADPNERARKAVTERIRDTITRIEKAVPPLGAHLRRSIRTGAFCAYQPDEPVRWTL